MSRPSHRPRRTKFQIIIEQSVSKVVNGKPTDIQIINELAILTEYIEKKNYTLDEIQTAIPTFANLTFDDMVLLHKEIYTQLANRIKKASYMFLQIYRMYYTLTVMKPEKRIPESNHKIKFCNRYYCCRPFLLFRQRWLS